MISGEIKFCNYRPRALIKVTGSDALSFLQGQFTNELRQDPGSSTYGLWLNPKGKVVADSYVLRLAENEFFLASVASPAAVIRQRLEDYIVADDVALADETEAACGLALVGSGCGDMMEKIFGARPGAGQFARSGDALVFGGRRTRAENYEIIGPEAAVAGGRTRLLAQGCRETGGHEMEYARIADGLPSIPSDLGPGDLPNEGGLEESAISFTKGCYLGQEVMARLKNMGRVRRRLQVVVGNGAPPRLPALLYQGEKKIGEIRSLESTGSEFIALAMLALTNFDPAAGLSLQPNGPAALRIKPHG